MSIARNILLLIIIVSTILFLLSISILVLFPSIYEKKLEEQTNIARNSMLYDMWIDLPLPIYQGLYFFNITNSGYFTKYGGVLEVEEVGPYTYKSHWFKEGIEWHSNGTVSYREVKIYEFVPEKSVGNETDKIYTLNGPLIMAADFLKDKGPKIRKGADTVFRFIGETLVIQKTVKKLAFGGYKDPIIGFSMFFRPKTPFKGSTFSWLYGQNATDDGVFTVFTGEKDHQLLNIIDKWNGRSHLQFWKNSSCNMINGTNAEFGPPLHKDQIEYTFFQPIFCRSITFNYTETKIHHGIKSKRFENNVEIFSKSNPDNYCFDTDPELESGVLSVETCRFGAPIVLSFPHFYLASTEYLVNIDGLDPNRENHSSHIDVEPLSGISVDLSMKLQINVKMEPVENLSTFKYVSAGVYPIFWVELYTELTDSLVATMKDQLYRPKIIAHVAIGGIMVISIIMFIVAIWKLIKLKDSDDTEIECEKKPLLTRSRDSSYAATQSDQEKSVDAFSSPNAVIQNVMATT